MHKAPVRCLLGFLFNNNNTNICNAHSVSKHTESEAQLSQSNAEVLVRWGGKTKHDPISYFLSNTSAENYRNHVVYVKIVASQRWDVFWDTV